MKRIILAFLSFLVLSCTFDYEWPPYTSFEEATAEITAEYGQPTLLRATNSYDNDDRLWYQDYPDYASMSVDEDSIRNVLVFWRIDPPIIEEYIYVGFNGREYLRTREYNSYSIEIWNQTYEDKYDRYRQYGWEILRETKSGAEPKVYE